MIRKKLKDNPYEDLVDKYALTQEQKTRINKIQNVLGIIMVLLIIVLTIIIGTMTADYYLNTFGDTATYAPSIHNLPKLTAMIDINDKPSVHSVVLQTYFSAYFIWFCITVITVPYLVFILHRLFCMFTNNDYYETIN